MTCRTSRRRIAQTALVTAAMATLPRSRAAFSFLLPGAEGVQIAQLGVLFTIGAEGQADAALVSLGGVGSDAAATFTRIIAAA